jgi:hypothetical protein
LSVKPEYRRFAQACLEMAETTADKRTRAVCIQMAQVWFRLAEKKPVEPENPLKDAD